MKLNLDAGKIHLMLVEYELNSMAKVCFFFNRKIKIVDARAKPL